MRARFCLPVVTYCDGVAASTTPDDAAVVADSLFQANRILRQTGVHAVIGRMRKDEFSRLVVVVLDGNEWPLF
jgi:hypothetical protein